MSSTGRWILIGGVGVIALVALVLLGVTIGLAIGRPVRGWPGTGQGVSKFVAAAPGWLMPGAGTMGGPGMMGFGQGRMGGERGALGYGSGMLGSGPGMMGYGPGTSGYGRGMMGNDPETFGYGQGMMGGGPGMMEYGEGMIDPGSQAGELTLEEVEERLADYLAGSDELEVGEIMIFDNHAYAQIVEGGTGIGGMEVLIDPVTLSVFPEHGPNMMWNLKYGMMGGRQMSGMTSLGDVPGDPLAMPVSEEDAVQLAQDYLDRYAAGLSADEHADRFYGYYTLHTLEDEEVVGMLSVNGYTGQVFPHTWHGELLEMNGSDDH